MQAATDFEFKQRFWIIGGIFGLAFLSYNVDRQNAGAALVDWIAHLHRTVASDAGYHVVFFLAALLVLIAALIRTWATAYLDPEVMMGSRVHTSHLVADGPYRYVRNPLYLANILLAVGFGLMASRLGFCILVLGMWLFVYRLILREEAGIAAHQGQGYLAYCAAVPRLLPSPWPKLPAGDGVADWSGGILGEAFIWVMAAAVFAFAVTLNQRIYFWVLGSAFVVYGVCAAIIQKRRKRAND